MIHSSDRFTWKGNKGVADRSDFGQTNPETRFSAGFCDVGFDVISERTGRKLRFKYVFDEDGYDGEFAVYSAIDNYETYFITIIND